MWKKNYLLDAHMYIYIKLQVSIWPNVGVSPIDAYRKLLQESSDTGKDLKILVDDLLNISIHSSATT